MLRKLLKCVVKWPLVDKENQKPVDNFSDDLLFDANSCFTHVKRRKLVSADVNVPRASKYYVTIKDINEDTSSENGDDSNVDVDYDHFENDLNIVDNTEHDDNDFLLQTEFITSGDNHDKSKPSCDLDVHQYDQATTPIY